MGSSTMNVERIHDRGAYACRGIHAFERSSRHTLACAGEESVTKMWAVGEEVWAAPVESRTRPADRAPTTHSLNATHMMSNYFLSYGISKSTPASPKMMKEILDIQTNVNRLCTWTHEPLALAAPTQAPRSAFVLPLVRFGHVPSHTPHSDAGREPASRALVDGFATGATRVRDNLWNAHLVAAFLKYVSGLHPTLLFELRDEGGFVVPGSVWIRGGKVEPNREFLNRERTRALELTGDAQAAGPYVWAELQGLTGSFFQDAPASDYAGVSEIEEHSSWDEIQNMSLEDIATRVVERATAPAVPALA